MPYVYYLNVLLTDIMGSRMPWGMTNAGFTKTETEMILLGREVLLQIRVKRTIIPSIHGYGTSFHLQKNMGFPKPQMQRSIHTLLIHKAH